MSAGITSRASAPRGTRLGADLAALAPLVEYPSSRSIATAIRCRTHFEATHPTAAAAVGRFLEWLANEPAESQEEIYTRTFYVTPLCVPYVSVHIFGDESFQRGRLMARLREAYGAAGFDAGTELPDHIGVLLRFAPHLGGDELDELVEYCLAGPVARMAGQLERTRNPYLHALAAVRIVLGQEIPEADPS